MRIVVKFAGALLEDTATVQELSHQVAQLARHGHEILVVHGGGRLFTAMLKRLGIESTFVSGLRVTDKERRDVAVMVFAGLLNKRLAAAITAEGHPAVGISAADAACFSASPLVHNDVEGSLGYVGYLTSVNVRFLESLWQQKLIPVAPCLGLGADNELYNINADHMAAACAEFIAADHLVYLTDVAGVLDGDNVLSAVSCEEIRRRHGAEAGSGKTGPRRRRPRSTHRWREFCGCSSRARTLLTGGPGCFCGSSGHARPAGIHFRGPWRCRHGLGISFSWRKK